jgi:RNA polymerase sigma factor (sigma-70 family)
MSDPFRTTRAETFKEPAAAMPNRNQLIEANLQYAKGAASKYGPFGRDYSSPEWQDAYAAACEAMVKAASTYDPSRASFATHAWPRMKQAILRMRAGEKRRASVETMRRHALEPKSYDGFEKDQLEDRDEFHAELVESPEDLMLAAEEKRAARERLSRLPFRARRVVETVLDGGSLGTGSHALNAAKIALEAGVRVPASAIPEKKPLSGAARSARWFARLSPEKRAARQEAKNARRRLARQEVRAA